MMRKLIWLMLSLVSVWSNAAEDVGVTPIINPSFDCNTKLGNVERLICESEYVSSLDKYLTLVYKRIIDSKLVNSDALKDNQLKWLSRRNLCMDRDCLAASYSTRIDQIIIMAELSGSTFLRVSELRDYFSDQIKRHNESLHSPAGREAPILKKSDSFEGAAESEIIRTVNLVPENIAKITASKLISVQHVYDSIPYLVLNFGVSDLPSQDINYYIESYLFENKYEEYPYYVKSSRLVKSLDFRAPLTKRQKIIDKNLKPVYEALLQLQKQGEYTNTVVIRMIENESLQVVNGADQYMARTAGEIILGGDKKDVIVGDSGEHIYITLGGDDDVRDSWGSDLYITGEGNDIVDDSWGNDVVYSGLGDDVIDVGYDTDIVFFGKKWGHDTLDMTCHTGVKYLVFDKTMDITKLVTEGSKLSSPDHKSSITLNGSCYKLVQLEERVLD